jgi:predicted TPR repeat methyltransferase
MSRAEFDAYAETYDQALGRTLALVGEDKEYFARGRVGLLRRVLQQHHVAPATVLDFGCGTGSAVPYLRGISSVRRITGVDVSAESVRVAGSKHGSDTVHFATCFDLTPANEFDLAFCNGVFHHIGRQEQARWMRYIHHALRPGGYFALWENNPWNPGTRYLMSHCEFDRDAVMISPGRARRLISEAGFETVQTDYAFLFPRFLRALRPLESLLCQMPIGGQYQVLAKKSA